MSSKFLSFIKEQNRLRTNTPQSQPVPGRESEMVQNRAGGYVFKMDPFDALRRALLLGSADNTYYATGKELTKEFCELVQEAISLDPMRAGAEIVYASEGRALNNSAPLLALTLLSGCPKAEAKQVFRDIFPKVVRTASHFYEWMAFTKNTRGFGKVVKKVGRGWFEGKSVNNLTYQFLKYSQRNGYEGRDLLRLFHLKPETDERQIFYRWLVKGTEGLVLSTLPESMSQVRYLEMLKAKDIDPVSAIEGGRLSHEMVSSYIGQDLDGWTAIFNHMPLGALLRNLGSLTAKGVLAPGNRNVEKAVARLTDKELVTKARLHPMGVIKALYTYRGGSGIKGKLSWTPIPAIVDALETAFEHSFETCALPENLVYKIFIDVSGSMNAPAQGSDGMFNCAEAAALMALVIAKKVKNYEVIGFSSLEWNVRHETGKWSGQLGKGKGLCRINLFGKDTCASAVSAVKAVMGGGTDTSLPFQYLNHTKSKADVVICFTDNETWAGHRHPFQTLAEYRKTINPNVKVVYGTLEPSTFTLADRNDPLAMDIVGFSPDTARAIEMFVNGFSDTSSSPSLEEAV